MTDKLTDFTDTSDVSDAAIEWVRHAIPAVLLEDDCWSVADIREDAKREYSIGDRAILIAARLIEAHRPELLVDPVDAIVREELARAAQEEGFPKMADDYRSGKLGDRAGFQAAKRLYLMGMEKGRSE
jgi:hypothetical protein